MNNPTQTARATAPFSGPTGPADVPVMQLAASLLRNPYLRASIKLFTPAAALAQAMGPCQPIAGKSLDSARMDEPTWMAMCEAMERLMALPDREARERSALSRPLTEQEAIEWADAWAAAAAARDDQHAVELVVNALASAGSPLHMQLRAEWQLPEGDATLRRVEFGDAQAMAREHPDTFEAPTPEALSSIVPGHFVKVECAGERFWTRVSRREGTRMWARVSNDLARSHIHGLRDRDEVEYSVNNVYSTEPPID